MPDALLRAMVRMRLDPFVRVERTLGDVDCARRRLRPDSALRSFGDGRGAPDPFAEAARAHGERMSPGACRKAWDALFGLDKNALEAPED